MASVDVPVALLGYGTVGSAVNYFLTQNGDDIERATGHRLRVVKALVRDLEQGARLQPAAGRPDDATSPRSSTTRRSRVVAEVMGGVEPTGGYVLDLLHGGQADRDREQAAARPARRRALRGGGRGRRPAALRGVASARRSR